MSTNTGFGEPPRRGSNGTYSFSSRLDNLIERFSRLFKTKNGDSFVVTYNNGRHEKLYLSDVLKYKYITEEPINGQFHNGNLPKLLEDKHFITYGLGANVIYLSMLLQQRRPIILAKRINGNGTYRPKKSIMYDEIKGISAKGLEKYIHR
nr:hypothetical protein [Candidatus Woesearchaeota archaeon]